MAQSINILVMVHGMVIDRESLDYSPVFDGFWERLQKAQPALTTKIAKFIKVQWAHPLPGQTGDLRPDQKLTGAENFIADNVNYANLKKTPGPNNVVLGGLGAFFEDIGGGPPWFPILRGFLDDIKERIFLLGFSDAVYYCSPEGERQVRMVVYEQILGQLAEFTDKKEVRLHLFGHSLGVTVAHDFLYGLFGSEDPDFLRQGTTSGVELFRIWKAKAANGELKLGSFSTTASQLPLFMMRKQKLVDNYYQGKKLDPAALGITSGPKIQWKLFYDADDVLGYPSRNLYEPVEAVKEIQVGTGASPEKAHNGYWQNQTVITEIADLIEKNCQ